MTSRNPISAQNKDQNEKKMQFPQHLWKVIYINLRRFLIPTQTPSVASSNLIYIQGWKPKLEPQNDQKDTP